jgi:hypothetical protein
MWRKCGREDMEVMTVSSSEVSDDGGRRGSGRSTSTFPQEQLRK